MIGDDWWLLMIGDDWWWLVIGDDWWCLVMVCDDDVDDDDGDDMKVINHITCISENA